MQKREPHFRPDKLPTFGLRIDEEGTVEAAEAASLMVSDAQARGAQLVSGSVASMLNESGSVKGVVLMTGEKYFADHVVLAAGVESTRLCATVGIELPVTSRTGLLVHSKPTQKDLINELILAPELHMRQTVDGCLVAGAGFTGSDAGDDPAKTAQTLFAKVKDMFNTANTDTNALQLESFTIGVRPMPLDGMPILGTTDVKGLTLAVMHSGVTLAPIAGEHIADEIVHGKTDAALRTFSLSRTNLSKT